jgi:hypothetical protein
LAGQKGHIGIQKLLTLARRTLQYSISRLRDASDVERDPVAWELRKMVVLGEEKASREELLNTKGACSIMEDTYVDVVFKNSNTKQLDDNIRGKYAPFSTAGPCPTVHWRHPPTRRNGRKGRKEKNENEKRKERLAREKETKKRKIKKRMIMKEMKDEGKKEGKKGNRIERMKEWKEW